MAHCVNKSHKDFKTLLVQTDIDPLILAAKISVWQEENNNLDTFPTLYQLGIELPTEKLEFPKTDSGWKKAVAKARTYNGPNSAINAKVEIKLSPTTKGKSEEVYFIKFTEKPKVSADEVLDAKLRLFLDKIGVTIQTVKYILDKDGKPTNVIAMARMLENIIQVAQGKEDISTLPHEVGHFFEAMLAESHPLKQLMMEQIVKYPIYKQVYDLYSGHSEYQVDGKPDIDKIKREAIGQLIGQELVNLHKMSDENPIKRWIRVVKNKIKDALSKLQFTSLKEEINNALQEYNVSPFQVAAQQILDGEINGLTNKGKDNLYQLNTAQQALLSQKLDEADKKIRVKEVLRDEKDPKGEKVHEYDILDNAGKVIKTIKMSASRLAKKMTDFKTSKNKRTKSQQLDDEKRRDAGNEGHRYAKDIVDNLTSANKVQETAIYQNLNAGEQIIYNKLQAQLKILIEDIQTNKDTIGSIFKTEIAIYDPTMKWEDSLGRKHVGVAGTIDLLVLHADGTVSIYDWKTIGSEELNVYKMLDYGNQISLYKDILSRGNREMGIPKVKGFKKTRLITFKTTLHKVTGKITNIEFKEVIPVAAESTNNRDLDAKIEELDNRMNSLLAQKAPADPQKSAARRASIDSLKRLIIKLRIDKTYKTVSDNAEDDLIRAQNLLMQKNITFDDLKEAGGIINMYIDINSYSPPESLKNKQFQDDIKEIMWMASNLQAKHKQISEDLVQKEADEQKVEGVFNTQKRIGKMASYFKSISEFNHPMIEIIHNLIKQALSKSRVEADTFRAKNIEQIDKLKVWASNKGISLQEAYNKLVNKSTGNLIGHYKVEFWREFERAQNEMDLKWLATNVSINKIKLDEWKKNKDKGIKEAIYPGDKKFAEYSKTLRLKDAADYYNMHSNLMTVGKSWIQPKSDKMSLWESVEYMELHKSGNEPLREFYEFFTSNVRELSSSIPEADPRPGFIPNVRSELIEDLMRSDLSAIGAIGKSLKDSITVNKNEDTTLGMFDEMGNQVKKIPTWHLDAIDPSRKSYDLGKVLQLFAEMSYNYQNMDMIEDKTSLILDVLKTQKAFETDSRGRLKREQQSGKTFMSEEANKTYVEAANLFVDYYLYGIRTDNPNTFTEVVDTLNKVTAFRMLALNPFSGLVASTANMINLSVQASRGNFFTKVQCMKSAFMISGGSSLNGEKEKVFGLLKLFEPLIDPMKERATRRLSSNILLRNVDMSSFFVLLRKPDELVQSTTFLSMMQSHALIDGKLVHIESFGKKSRPDNYYTLSKEERVKIDADIKSKQTSLKSVWDSVTFDGNEIKIPGLDKLDLKQIDAIRNKIQQINKSIVGNVDHDDVYGYRQFAWARALMLFRNWMPKSFKERFGSLQYNRELELNEWGRYNTFISKVFGTTRDDAHKLKWNLLLSTEKAALLAYNEHIVNHPESNMTENEFVDLYKSNMNAQYQEMKIMLGVLVIMIAGGRYIDDPDKKKGLPRYALKVAKRTFSEMAMFWNPTEALKIIQTPAAAISIPVDVLKTLDAVRGEIWGHMIGDEKAIKAAKPLKHLLGWIPGLNPIERTIRDFNQKYSDFIEK